MDRATSGGKRPVTVTWRALAEPIKDFQTRVEIKGLQIWGRHGVLEEEGQHPQQFELDIVLSLPTIKQDQLSQTVDYRQVLDVVFDLNQSQSFQLIEVFAHTLAAKLLDEFSLVQSATVCVKKHPALPVGVHLDHVCAEVHVQRPNQSPHT